MSKPVMLTDEPAFATIEAEMTKATIREGCPCGVTVALRDDDDDHAGVVITFQSQTGPGTVQVGIYGDDLANISAVLREAMRRLNF